MADGTDDGRIIRVTKIVKIPLPKELQMLAALGTGGIAFLVALVNDPLGTLREVVFRLITEYILAGIFAIIGVIAGSVLYAFDIIVGALEFARDLLVGAFAVVGVDIIGALLDMQREIVTVVEGAGPAAPIIAVAAAVVGTLILYRLAVAGLELAPGGSSILSLLRLR